MTFDQLINEALRETCLRIVTQHPEVRSIAAVVDYNGGLNDADVLWGVWLGDEGQVQRPDAVMGSLFSTLKLLTQQSRAAADLLVDMRGQATLLGAEINKRYETLRGLEERIAAASGGSPEAQSQSGAAASEARPQAGG